MGWEIRISLHTLICSVRMQVSINGWLLTVMIDSGSTHNFIHETIVHKLGLGMQSLLQSRCLLAVVSISSSRRFIKKFLSSSKDHLYRGFLCFAIEGTNLVLRVQWLEALGIVSTNHKEQCLSYAKEGMTIILQDDKQLVGSAILGNGLHQLVAW